MSRVSISMSKATAETLLAVLDKPANVTVLLSGVRSRLRVGLRRASAKSSSVCQWCGKDILSEPCGPSHKMRKRLAEAKKRKKTPRAESPPYVALKEWAYPKPGGDRKKALRKESRREETAAIREACLKRANGVCECGCGRAVIADPAFANLDNKAELEHPFSKGKGARLPQSVETCWILRADCHRDRTNNRPGAATWWRKFVDHCRAHVSISKPVLNAALARLRFVEVRAALPSSPRTRHD